MKLKQLLDCPENSDFILLHDNKDAKGDILLLGFIKENVKLGNTTDVLCFQRNPNLMKNLPTAANLNVHFLKAPFCWIHNVRDSSEPEADPLKLLRELHTRPRYNSKHVIIIDSLSLLLLLYSDKCYREIHYLLNFNKSSSSVCQIICLLHSDVILSGKKYPLMFERLAHTNLYIKHQNKKSEVTIKHRKSSGRIIEVTEQFYFDQDFNLVTKEIFKVKETHFEDENKDWLTKDVTFKLELGDKEKRARSELVLPYVNCSFNVLEMGRNEVQEKLRNQDIGNKGLNVSRASNAGGSGDIIYEPDETDDWDEEDPDDDLNI